MRDCIWAVRLRILNQPCGLIRLELPCKVLKTVIAPLQQTATKVWWGRRDGIWVCCLDNFAVKKTKAWLFIEGRKNVEWRNSKHSMTKRRRHRHSRRVNKRNRQLLIDYFGVYMATCSPYRTEAGRCQATGLVGALKAEGVAALGRATNACRIFLLLVFPSDCHDPWSCYILPGDDLRTTMW